MTHAERHARLTELHAEIRKLTFECVHFIPEKEASPTTGWYGGAICAGCGGDFGWYCPKSSDRMCHYHSHNGFIVDVQNNVAMPVPEGHTEDPGYDICIFCGDPEERK